MQFLLYRIADQTELSRLRQFGLKPTFGHVFGLKPKLRYRPKSVGVKTECLLTLEKLCKLGLRCFSKSVSVGLESDHDESSSVVARLLWQTDVVRAMDLPQCQKKPTI